MITREEIFHYFDGTWVTYSYDENGHEVKRATSSGWIEWRENDRNGKLSRQLFSDGRVRYYNPDGTYFEHKLGR